MFYISLPRFHDFIRPLTGRPKEVVVTYLIVAFFPVVLAVGGVVDYMRANSYKDAIQVALDAAVLSGGGHSGNDWTGIARDSFKANLSSKYVLHPKPIFAQDPSTGNYIGNVIGSWPTLALGIINIDSIRVSATATAVADHDNAFLLSPNSGQQNASAWSVSNLSGNTFLVTSAGQHIALSEGAILNPGNNMHTGQNGRVLLVRGQETILVGPNSIIGIPPRPTEGMSTTIYQRAGSTLLAVEKRSYEHFDVETPFLAAVVKGTRFRVAVSKDEASVEVLRGRVEVTDFKTGQHSFVLPRQEAKVLAQGYTGLSLSGSGTLNAVQQGVPRTSPLDLIANQYSTVQNHAVNERKNHTPWKAESERLPPSSEKGSTYDNSRSSGSNMVGRLVGGLSDQSNSPIIHIVLAGVLGLLAAATGQWIWRKIKQKIL